MRRDMALVRSILLDVANADESISIDQLTNENYDRQLVGYHISLLDEAGLIHASMQAADNDPYYHCIITSLTWEGNDFLDAIASDTVWTKVKNALSFSIGTTTLEVVKSVASKVGETLLLEQLGF